MSSINKIYGNYYQWTSFHDFVARSKRPQYCKYFYPTPQHGEDGKFVGCIANTPTHVDIWLLQNCPYEFVIKRLKEVYDKDFIKKHYKKRT